MVWMKNKRRCVWKMMQLMQDQGVNRYVNIFLVINVAPLSRWFDYKNICLKCFFFKKFISTSIFNLFYSSYVLLRYYFWGLAHFSRPCQEFVFSIIVLYARKQHKKSFCTAIVTLDRGCKKSSLEKVLVHTHSREICCKSMFNIYI